MSQKSIEAVLLDIDNTLILFDERVFFSHYLERLAPWFADLMPPDEFRNRLIQAGRRLLENQGRLRNADFYLDAFAEGLDDHRARLRRRFDRFYAEGFDSLRDRVVPLEEAKRVVGFLKRKGFRLVAASHPIWPESVQAIRLRWAGLDPNDFAWMTHIDNTTFCKPQEGFYREICEHLGILPERALMVGNDAINDMAAGLIGMGTYRTTDADTRGFAYFNLSESLRNPDAPIRKPDWEGPLSGLPDLIETIEKRDQGIGRHRMPA